MKEYERKKLIDVIFPDVKNYLDQIKERSGNASYYLEEVKDSSFVFSGSSGRSIEVDFEDAITVLKTKSDLLKLYLLITALKNYTLSKHPGDIYSIGGKDYVALRVCIGRFDTEVMLNKKGVGWWYSTYASFKTMDLLDLLLL